MNGHGTSTAIHIGSWHSTSACIHLETVGYSGTWLPSAWCSTAWHNHEFLLWRTAVIAYECCCTLQTSISECGHQYNVSAQNAYTLRYRMAKKLPYPYLLKFESVYVCYCLWQSVKLKIDVWQHTLCVQVIIKESSSSSSCSGRIRFDSCSLYPQNEIGPSIFSSVVLCVFVLLVYIVVLV